jgi:tetratricopeptide (TPR) repeat protein
MVLTPDQKKRIASLDTGPSTPPEEEPQENVGLSTRLKTLKLKATPAQITSAAIKISIVLAIVLTGAYYVKMKDLHKIKFKTVFSPGDGGPIKKLFAAIDQQGEKAALWKEGQGLLLEGDYRKVAKIAKNIEDLDPDDARSAQLIDDMVAGITLKAQREFESGDMEASIRDVEFALKHRKDDDAATRLYQEIADRLLLEALAHADRKEYEQLIIKCQKVNVIDPGNIEARNLLFETNDELLDLADEHFFSRQYTKALEKVLLAMKIDARDARTQSLLKKIKDKIAAPKPVLHSIIAIRGQLHAILQLPGERRRTYVKKGETLENAPLKVISIDLAKKQVRLRQIHTGEVFVLLQVKAE